MPFYLYRAKNEVIQVLLSFRNQLYHSADIINKRYLLFTA